MLLGAIAEKYHLLGPGTAIAINQYVTYFALPALLFTSIASVKIDSILNWNFIIAYSIGMFATFILCFAVAKFVLQEPNDITALKALSASFPNASYMGIPLLSLLIGPKTVVPITIITIIQFFLMVVTILIINSCNTKKNASFNFPKLVFTTLVKNPIVSSGLLGILWSLTGLHLPKPIYTIGHELGITAGTCALFAIGKIMMSLKPTIKFKEQSIISIFKLGIQPLITLPLLFYFKVPILWAICGFVVAALPPVTLIYILSQQYHLQETNFSGVLLVTSLLSIITIPIALTFASHFWPHLHSISIIK